MPKCNKSEAQTIDFVYGELNPSQVVDFEQHLTTCENCTKKVNAYKRVLHLVDEAEEELTSHVIVPHNLEMKLYRRLAKAPSVKPSLSSRLSDFTVRPLLILREQKVASICIFTFAVIAIAFFVGNPFNPAPTFEASHTDSADARIEQYRHQDIQRSMEDVLRKKHLRNSDEWDTVSDLNRVKDHAQGTNWANIAKKQLKSVHSEL
ncbi:hypothetical protein J4G08_09820 [Candidatus Poribacteria bacterium]|nr:hypothetical protein [Candidatus Poribacteria bacterium]